LQQVEDLPEGQHDIPRASSGCSGAPYDAQNAANASTARMTRPLKRDYHITPVNKLFAPGWSKLSTGHAGVPAGTIRVIARRRRTVRRHDADNPVAIPAKTADAGTP